MISRELRCSRRKFLASTAALTLGGAGVSAGPSASIDSGNRRPIAVLGSVYRPLSYLYHLAGRFLHGVTVDGQPWMPQHRIASLWLDQTPENDLSRDLSRKFGIRRARTVREALVQGDRLAVDGVLIVAEHGNYPRNERGQILYPRAAIFNEVVEAFRAWDKPRRSSSPSISRIALSKLERWRRPRDSRDSFDGRLGVADDAPRASN